MSVHFRWVGPSILLESISGCRPLRGIEGVASFAGRSIDTLLRDVVVCVGVNNEELELAKEPGSVFGVFGQLPTGGRGVPFMFSCGS